MTNTEKVYGAYPAVPMPGMKSLVARYHNARAMFRAADSVEATKCKIRGEMDMLRFGPGHPKVFTQGRNRQIARARLFDFRVLQAWKALGDATTDPLVKWIVDNFEPGHPWHYEAVEALSEMPCTREQLFALALESNWCNEFEDAIARAEEAGVL